MSDDLKKRNTRLVVKLVLFVVLMFGFGYALVPLYDVLCDIAGQNIKVQGTTESAAAFAIDETKDIRVEFITSVNGKTPMTFRAETTSLNVHPGQFYTVNFYAKNNSHALIKAQAIPSISPGQTEEFFKKIQCFCFTTQTFEGDEEKIMPVRFTVDPKLPDRYKTITLSYTFFDITNKTEN